MKRSPAAQFGFSIRAREKTYFHRDDNPLAPALPPSGAGARCDVSELPARRLSARMCTVNMAPSRPGKALAADQ